MTWRDIWEGLLIVVLVLAVLVIGGWADAVHADDGDGNDTVQPVILPDSDQPVVIVIQPDTAEDGPTHIIQQPGGYTVIKPKKGERQTCFQTGSGWHCY